MKRKLSKIVIFLFCVVLFFGLFYWDTWKANTITYKEFELLTYFVENKGIALSREKILNNVWNYDYFGDARTIDTHVKKLRSKLGVKGDMIKTIWGMGYKLEE